MLKKIKFLLSFDRIGLDLPTSLILYSKRLTTYIYKRRFYHFGSNVQIRRGAYLCNLKRISLGRNVCIRPNSFIYASGQEFYKLEIVIEDDVLLGSGVHIYTNNHTINSRVPIIEQGFDKPKPVKIEKGAWVGANSIILPGVSIGKNSVIGAGSVVTKNVLPNAIYAGNPARLIKKIEA